MTWAQRRKLIYLGGLFLFLFVIVVIPSVIYFYKAPTCFDGKQNQDEQGIDCGGKCDLLCPQQYAGLNIIWSRFSKVNDGVYNVLAYIENPNINAGIDNLNYVFKIYDKDGVLLRERVGRATVPANKIMAIFEPELLTGNQIPKRVEFSFSTKPIWHKQESRETNLAISQSLVSREDSAPRLTFVLNNKTVNLIKQIEAIGIIYDVDGNTIAFSRTIIDDLAGQESRTISFNWPRPFEGQYARTEILVKVLK